MHLHGLERRGQPRLQGLIGACDFFNQPRLVPSIIAAAQYGAVIGQQNGNADHVDKVVDRSIPRKRRLKLCRQQVLGLP
jgi:hypothetical protein